MKCFPSRIRPLQPLFPALLSLVCASGCGGGGHSAVSGDAVERSLNELGIDTSSSPRRSDHGESLSENYSPLGKTLRIDPLMELYVGGVPIDGSTAVATLFEDFAHDPPDGSGTITPEPLFALDAADAPWWPESLPPGSFRQTKRAVTAADVDGDGIDEVVTVFVEDPTASLQIVRRTDTGFETSLSTVLFNTPGITDVAIVAGDFDGDTIDDLAIGYSALGVAHLLHLVRDEAGGYSIEPSTQRTFSPNLNDSSIDLILRAGNIDDDDPLELVALVNETSGSAGNPHLTSRFIVMDDRTTEYRELHSGFVEGFETNVGLQVAAVADVALGDIDGDNRDEIVFGGLAELDDDCSSSRYVFVALDDATMSFESLGARGLDVSLDGCADDPAGYDLRFVHVRTLDLDGDGLAEVLGNQLVFEDWKTADPWTQVPAYSLSSREIVDEAGLEWSDATNCAIAVGDVTGDGREDVLIWRGGTGELRVFGLEAGETHIHEIGHVETSLGQGLINPVLLPVNVDKDSKVVRATGVHRFLYLEPIVAAVLASPPCRTDGSQNSSVCQTTFGNTTSNETEFERSASFSIGGMYGFKFQSGILNSEVEMEAKLTRKLTLSAGVAYSLEKSVIFTTGAAEDTVVFTTVPVDLYEYRILQHPDSSRIGQLADVILPREAIYLQVERGFYNSHIAAGSMPVDERIFRHTIGSPDSYPSRSEKDALLSQYGGLEIGPQSVGQGAGQTELQLVVGAEWNVGGELELEFELEAKTTITGATIGLTVGSSTSSSIQWTSGHSTTYDGVVGSIDAEHFQHDQYEFGLFTYPQYDPTNGQQFEVINYWVQ
jgi:hypothetical protein